MNRYLQRSNEMSPHSMSLFITSTLSVLLSLCCSSLLQFSHTDSTVTANTTRLVAGKISSQPVLTEHLCRCKLFETALCQRRSAVRQLDHFHIALDVTYLLCSIERRSTAVSTHSRTKSHLHVDCRRDCMQ